jgi:GT2 family glycosyltransferase
VRRVAIVIPTLNRSAAQLAGRLALRRAKTPARLIVVGGPERGFTRTVNDGLRQVRADEDVCLLNDDIVAQSFRVGWLRDLQAGLYSADDYGIAGPLKGRAAGDVYPVAEVAFWCALIRREVLDAVGLLDERYIHYASDNEYCARARRAGWQVVRVSAVQLVHTLRGSGKRTEWWKHDQAIWSRVKREWGIL